MLRINAHRGKGDSCLIENFSIIGIRWHVICLAIIFPCLDVSSFLCGRLTFRSDGQPPLLARSKSCRRFFRSVPPSSVLCQGSLPTRGKYMEITDTVFESANRRAATRKATFPAVVSVRYDRRVARIVLCSPC